MSYDIMEVLELLDGYETALKKAVDSYKTHILNIRAGRANPHILDKVMVDYYGTPTPLNQMGSITVPEAKMIVVSIWDGSALKAAEKAIIDANVGITPNNDGKVIRLVFPELTEEKRKETSKDVRKRGEGAKVALRNIRRDVMELIKKEKKESIITEDDQKDLEEKLQKLTDDYIKKVDQMVDIKTKEVMAV